jgi:hypothetical protein
MKTRIQMKSKRLYILLALLALTVCAIPFRHRLRRPFAAAVQRAKNRHTVASRVAQYGDAVRDRLVPDFDRIGVAYPPSRIVLVGLKNEKRLEVWVAGSGSGFSLLKTYPVLAASGALGPKLQEGDLQVPEGIYRIESLNPNSMFHLSLRVNYPNSFDRAKAAVDGRSNLGGDIMIHGNKCSIGCLAMGDPAAEELFVLAARTGIDEISVILSPVDFRTRDLPERMPPVPEWAPSLYERIRIELSGLKGDNET